MSLPECSPFFSAQWSAGSVADLYRCRWQIEVFFRQIKQSLQLCDFLGNSANAVRWQVWTALLLYVLTRFLCVISSWNHSFIRGHLDSLTEDRLRVSAALLDHWRLFMVCSSRTTRVNFPLDPRQCVQRF